MNDNDFCKEEGSLAIYIIKDTDYIMKRTINKISEYYYCSVSDAIINFMTIRGKVDGGMIKFENNNFKFKISEIELKKKNKRDIC
jgi:hypothetical protein